MSYVRDERRPSHHHVDSVVGGPLLQGETATMECRHGTSETDGSIVGIASGTPGTSVRPRAAWRLDVTTLRIKSLQTDSVACDIPDMLD